MYIVWKGMGLAVAPIAIVTIIVANVASGMLESAGLMPVWASRVAWMVSTILGAALIWAMAMQLAGKPRKRVNPKTGQEFLARDHAYAGHFCYLPTRYWALVLLALGVTMIFWPEFLS